MFGYILPDKPNLYMKDYALYRAFYCGLCHQIGRCQGQCMRLAVNYDVTFVTILLHGVSMRDLPFEKKACILNPFKKKVVVKETELLRKTAYLNALLVDFKCRDDVADDKSAGKRVVKGLIKGKVKKARKELPKVAEILDRAFDEQERIEKNVPDNWHVAADGFAEAVKAILRELAGDKYVGELGMIGYLLGQYVYLLDAIDDYDKDKKKGRYNPLLVKYRAESKAELVKTHGDELRQEAAQIVAMVKDNYQHIPIFCTEGIVTNTLWMGLMARYGEVTKENAKCLKTHTRF